MNLEMTSWANEGNEMKQFAAGCMQPKVHSAIHFVEKGNKRYLSTSIDSAMMTPNGDTGAIVTNEKEE